MSKMKFNYTQAEVEEIVLEYARKKHEKTPGYQMSPGHGDVKSTITAGYHSADPRESSASHYSVEVSFDETELPDWR